MYEEIEMEEFAKKWYTEEVLECLYELGFEAVTDDGDRIIGDHDGRFDFLFCYENGDKIGLSLDIGFNTSTNDYIGKGYDLELQLKTGEYKTKTIKRPEELIDYLKGE